MAKLVEGSTLITDVVTQLPSFFRKAKSQSIIEFGRPARNDFLTLIENDLVGLPYMNDVMQSSLSMVSGYFLNAVTLLVDTPNVDIVGKLDQLNTNRDPIEGVLGSASSLAKYVGAESFEYGLPSHGNYSLPDVAVALEAAGNTAGQMNKNGGATYGDNVGTKNQGNDHVINTKGDAIVAGDGATVDKSTKNSNVTHNNSQEGKTAFSMGKDNIKTISELSNLSVGKMLDVTFEKDGNKAQVGVMLRLAVTNTDAESMRTILTIGGGKNTLKQRWLRMKSGELAFVKDLLLCNDIVEESKKTRMRDKSGFFEHMIKRRSKNFLSGILSLKPSINNASAVIGITEETARSIQAELGGKLDKFKIRENLFKETSAMIIFVVDRKWEQVTFYHRSIDASTTLTLRDLKRAGSGQGTDVEDILRAYSAGNAPVI